MTGSSLQGWNSRDMAIIYFALLLRPTYSEVNDFEAGYSISPIPISRARVMSMER